MNVIKLEGAGPGEGCPRTCLGKRPGRCLSGRMSPQSYQRRRPLVRGAPVAALGRRWGERLWLDRPAEEMTWVGGDVGCEGHNASYPAGRKKRDDPFGMRLKQEVVVRSSRRRRELCRLGMRLKGEVVFRSSSGRRVMRRKT